ncbi:hypothetical protein A2555_00065 [Candidatus Falkowbacteria bacterium RIFOXYD2_FULL_39_16]|nr:MAG: hypothetical protein A2555_00065 [Candidatus Falkowbacteria bacterium RIFOXYD2_FULL_39_16]
MNCKYCNNQISDGQKFCGKCGKPVNLDSDVALVKAKTISGFRKAIGIIIALLVFGALGKALMVIIKIGTVLLFGIESTEGYADAEAIGNILGFVGGAYLANLVYIAIAGKDRSGEKKKWYQFGGFMATGGKTKARPILAVVIIIIAVFALILSAGFDSFETTRDKAVESGQYVPTDNWISYNNAPDFSVDFPSRPVHDTKTQDTPNGKVQIDSYKTANETADVAYIVNVSSFLSGIDISDSSAFLENTVQLSASNGTVIKSTQTTKDGRPAVDYLIEIVHPDTTSIIRGLNILVDNKLYQLLTAYDKQQESLLQYDKFINSFEVK